MKLGDISLPQLFSTKSGSIALTLTGIYYCIINLILMGSIDYTDLILGLTFIAVAVVYAKPKPLVLSGVLAGFLGVVNLLSIANVLPINTGWILTLVFAIAVIIMEAGLKWGKASKNAKVGIIIPMLSLFFMFILAIVGINPALYVNWATEPLKFINYLALMLLTGILSFQMLGWNLVKKNQGMWITVLGIVCVITSFIGIYQGTLAW